MSYTSTPQVARPTWSFPRWEGTDGEKTGTAAIVIRGDETGLGWRASSDETSALSALYSFDNYSEVHRVLIRSDDARALLFDVFPRLTRTFGIAAQLTLQVLDDPDDASQFLSVLVRTGLSPEEALSRLRSFDDGWWRAVAVQTDSLVIDVE
jgi:hypothetical protein